MVKRQEGRRNKQEECDRGQVPTLLLLLLFGVLTNCIIFTGPLSSPGPCKNSGRAIENSEETSVSETPGQIRRIKLVALPIDCMPPIKVSILSSKFGIRRMISKRRNFENGISNYVDLVIFLIISRNLKYINIKNQCVESFKTFRKHLIII